jgi:hypothetical protein
MQEEQEHTQATTPPPDSHEPQPEVVPGDKAIDLSESQRGWVAMPEGSIDQVSIVDDVGGLPPPEMTAAPAEPPPAAPSSSDE